MAQKDDAAIASALIPQGKTERVAAIMQGRNTYFGRPCYRGHDGLRYVQNRCCYHCAIKRGKYAKPLPFVQKPVAEVLPPKPPVKKDMRVGTSRPHALEIGARFYQGRECSKNHGGVRRVIGRQCAQCMNDSSREKRLANPALHRSYVKAYEARNPEKNRKRKQDYLMRNRNKFVVYGNNRRARKMQIPGLINIDDAAQLLVAQRGCCAYCGSNENLHLDHRIPLSKGGANLISNMQWLCASHNLAKNAKCDIGYRLSNKIPFPTERDAVGRVA